MRVLVVSDNHRDATTMEELLYIYDDIDLWLHCGDSEFNRSHVLWDTYKTVKGNMDFENEFPNTRTEMLEDTTFAVLHGHQHNVKRTLDLMEEVAIQDEASVVFYGHTHVAKVEKQNNIFFINPGSIRQPRGDIRVGSYAIYEKRGENEWIRFYDWNHNEILELSEKLK